MRVTQMVRPSHGCRVTRLFLGPVSHVCALFAVCEKQALVVCKDSPEEHLQPFKDRMADFSQKAKEEHKTEENNLSKAQSRLRLAQESVNKLTGEKKVETKKINPAASLKERLRQKEATVTGN
ncbi:hypothetical protein FKM82_016380 [Ascaphus truei]